MGLSNYIPNSRLAQPGVCTSTTRPSAPFEGQVIYETDTNRVLVYDASAWVMIADTDQPPGLQKVSSGTMTNIGTGGSFAQNVFSTDFTVHKVMFYDIIASQGNATFIQLANGTTQSDVNYYASGQYVLWGSNTGANVSTNNGSAWVVSSSAPSPLSSGEWTFFNVSQNVSTGFVAQKQNWDANETLAGYHNPATAYTGFRIYTNVGTTSLKYICYGYRN